MSISSMQVRVKHRQSNTADMEDTVKVPGVQVVALFQSRRRTMHLGTNCTDVSKLPSEHGVHTRKTVDRFDIIRTLFKR